MRIVMVTETIGDAFGQEKVVSDSTRLLQEVGHEVFFVGARRNSALPSGTAELLIDGLFGLHSFSSPSRIKDAKNDLVAFITKIKPDVIHFVDQLDFRLMKAIAAQVPSVATAHTVAPTCPASHRLISGDRICQRISGWQCLWHHQQYGCLGYLRSNLRRAHAIHSYMLKRKFLRSHSLMLAISRYVEKTLIADGWKDDRVRVVYNPVTIPAKIAPLDNIPKNLLVCASRLVPLKGIDHLIRSLKPLEAYEWTLWVCGDGPERKKLETLSGELGVSQRIRFLGPMAFKETQRIIASAFAYVQSNVGPEGFGMAVAEASGLGVPVVTYDVPALNEIVIHENNGLVAKARDVGAFSQCLKTLFENPDYARSLGAKGSVWVAQKFSPDQHMRQTIQAYEAAISA